MLNAALIVLGVLVVADLALAAFLAFSTSDLEDKRGVAGWMWDFIAFAWFAPVALCVMLFDCLFGTGDEP